MKIILICRRCYPFVVPVGVLLGTIFIAARWQEWSIVTSHQKELNAVLILFPYFPYIVLGMGTLLGWRFQKAGMMLASWLLGLTYWQFRRTPPLDLLELALSIALIELALLSRWRWQRLSPWWKMVWLCLLTLQAFLWMPPAFSHIAPWITQIKSTLTGSFFQLLNQWGLLFWGHVEKLLGFLRFNSVRPTPLFLIIVDAALVAQTYRKKDVLLAGIAGAFTAFLLCLGVPGKALSFNAACGAAGLILVASLIEASFSMAYHDDLTGLPGRRSLNETLSSLGRRYVIAMIDVDHFKKFNDTYGHKTGDEVLKMIAVHMQQMTGGAKPFRYGGEEFTAIFPGKQVDETKKHLESYRQKLSHTPFIVRQSARKRSSSSNRKTGPQKNGKQVHVTVSIGVAAPDSRFESPLKVIKAADAALYRAKRSGRNCIKYS